MNPYLDGCYFADIIYELIFLDENCWISIWISLKFDRNGQIDDRLALVRIMAWRRICEPMMA